MRVQLRVGSHMPSGGSKRIGKARGAPKPHKGTAPCPLSSTGPARGLGFLVGTH